MSETTGETTSHVEPQTTTLSSPPRWPSSSPNARPEYQVFAERLHEAMLKNKMNASQVAREVWGTTTDSRGVTVARNRDRIRHYLAGTSYPEPDNLKKLAEAVGLPVEDLTIDRPPTLPSPNTSPVRGSMIDPQVTILSTHHSVCLLQMRKLISLATALKIMELLGQDVVPDITETAPPVPAKA
jgi:hypothetical protein